VKAGNAALTLYEVPAKKTSLERAWISIPGKVKEIIGLEDAALMPSVRDVLPRAKKGDTVVFPRNNVEKCGNSIAVHECDAIALAAINAARKCIVVRLEPDNDDTERFIAGITEKGEEGFPPPAFPPQPAAEYLIHEMYRTQRMIPANTCAFKALYHPLQLILQYGKHPHDYDWNGRSITETISLYDKLCPTHPALDLLEFWRHLIRGGLQGILYLSDSSES
jgi:hypothetical protein